MYEPTLTDFVVPGLSAPANEWTTVAPCLICIVQSDATAVPPLSFTTCLTTVICGATSSFTSVHVFVSPAPTTTFPCESQSPE